ncbi:MAG: methylmalonyl Co-A mutase-associated GTPase MeaB, partial [Thermodesulfobacteriota bacterium]
VRSAHTTVIVVVPGMGDDIQAIKAGILEVGDIFVINKADREGTDKTHSDLRLMIEMDQKKYDEGGWKPPILKVEAVFDKGVAEFIDEIDRHARYLVDSGIGLHFRSNQERVRQELAEMVKGRLIEEVLNTLTDTGDFDRAVESITQGKTDPYTACDQLVLPTIRHSGESRD